MSIEIQILKNILNCSMGLFVFLAAFFKFRDSWQNQDDREVTRKKYGNLWRRIEYSGVLEIPEKIIISTLRLKDIIGDYIIRISGHEQSFRKLLIEFITVTAFLFAGNIILYPYYSIISISILLGWLVISAILYIVFSKNQRIRNLTFFVFFFFFFLLSFIGFISWLSLIAKLQISALTIIFVFISPICGYLFLWLAFQLFTALDYLFNEIFTKADDKIVSIIGYTCGISLPITMISLLIGNSILPNAYIPKTPQMFLVNLFFDGLTLITTFTILSYSVGINKKYSILTAVLVDIFFAALFACFSLYFGLFKTSHTVSINETINVLFATAQAGREWEFGPYFWVMHTTFIPTFIYLSVIFVSLIGKVIVLPFAKILQRGEVIEKPHDLTAMTFAFIAVILGFMSKLLDM